MLRPILTGSDGKLRVLQLGLRVLVEFATPFVARPVCDLTFPALFNIR
jgi:hypothetical protein